MQWADTAPLAKREQDKNSMQRAGCQDKDGM